MLINSDYPLDKVIYMASGSTTFASGGLPANLTIDHDLTFKPLIVGQWSYDADFSTVQEGGLQVYGDPAVASLSFFSTSTQILIARYNNTGSSVTLYYRMFGFMPSDVSELAPFTDSVSSDFVLNSDYNYMKLYDAGIVNLTSSSQTVAHDLGYRPRVLVWNDGSYIGTELVNSSFAAQGTVDYVEVDDTNVYFVRVGAGTRSYHYRIYLDA
jgi:hypothetical protein